MSVLPSSLCKRNQIVQSCFIIMIITFIISATKSLIMYNKEVFDMSQLKDGENSIKLCNAPLYKTLCKTLGACLGNRQSSEISEFKIDSPLLWDVGV